MFRDSMPPVLAAASALVVFRRCRVPAHVVQWLSAMLGTMLSQRWRAHASLQDKVCLGKERLQLLCCGCPLSALLLRLATVVEHSGRSTPSASRPFRIHFRKLCSKPLLFCLQASRVLPRCTLQSLLY
jgi:hypothetical protein